MNQKQFDKELGERIYKARVLERKSQVWLAKKLGVSQPHISKVESGKAGLSAYSLCRAYRAFGLNLDLITPLVEFA